MHVKKESRDTRPSQSSCSRGRRRRRLAAEETLRDQIEHVEKGPKYVVGRRGDNLRAKIFQISEQIHQAVGFEENLKSAETSTVTT